MPSPSYNRHIIIASCFCCLLIFSSAARVPKASKKHLARVKQLLNDEAERHNTLIQSDSVTVFDDIQRNPNTGVHHDELAVNNADEYFQGDVDLSEQQVKIIEDQFTQGKREKRKIGRNPLYKKWDTRGPISFDYAESIPFQTRQKIRSAMLLWQQHTCLRFEEGGPNVDRLEFFDGGGCSSFVGRVGGTQGISISTPGCDVVGIISHEIGHALGIFHEQARPDQERHIAINYNNIPLSRWNNFQAVGENHAETYNLPYDTGSVMHYGPYGFASDPYTPTIRTLERVQQSTIGQRAGPSFLDYQAINMAYGCTESCADLPCLRNGYTHPNNCSMCACPEGLSGRYCEQVYPSNAQCGGVIFATKEVKYITSPNYPDKFPIDTECNWIIAAPIEGRVFMEFEGDFDFLCEDTCDKAYVEVKYHSDKRLTGARYCCSLLPKNRFISFKNEMIIIMRGYRSSGAGFKAKFWSNLGEPEGVSTPLPPTTAPLPEISETTQKPEPTTVQSTTTYTTAIPRRTAKKQFFTRKPITIPLTPLTSSSTTTESTTVSSTTQSTTWLPTEPSFATGETEITTASPTITLFPSLSTILPPINSLAGVLPSTQAPDIINSVLECGCGAWSEWQGECSQQCGGCGHRLRKRECKKEACRKEEKRPCNFSACPDGTNFLINNAEFHILWRGCCVGLFRSGDQCSALETESNPFFKIINSLLNIQDAKNNDTLIAKRMMRGEH
ncbi:Zinc metalloproteinase nas-38 [Caenorhabditis elegans]|uniref:Zinc metalloproteinase nas-38 n=1 Tax=Caenorhabditis elegans TaxID=6239 RepID=NAS38_CAEEL|nr:Zinc metalloproteinase nas-38 [Caenorhabditis elegans]Q20942.3 RecName: Full=Zinc metalloproteinase nas-38; AltName: Full=Nematode astacin 38; Flags: Precursor [Caenorhabditis elegans]CCD69445.2 Zinc metalloproteinase nas-38 [Caenorhabditis elegans]